MDAAIYHGCRELGVMFDEIETPDIITSRILRGKCYLNLGRYRCSQREAEKVLQSDTDDSTAMYILAESLYLQCKVYHCKVLFSVVIENVHNNLLVRNINHLKYKVYTISYIYFVTKERT